MSNRSPHTLVRIVEHMAGLCAPRHRELARAMVAELESIRDPAERTRFALGAIFAIARLALTGRIRAPLRDPFRIVRVGDVDAGADPGGQPMSKLTTRQLLRRHAIPFAVSLASLTGFLLATQAVRQVPQLRARGVPTAEIVEVLLLGLPHTLGLTVPMAVFLAVSWTFTRLGAEGVIASTRRERHGVRRLLTPILGAAAVIAALTLVSNTQILPRANQRLAAELTGSSGASSDRTMSIGELRDAARRARTGTGVGASARAAAYEVEIQKKFALAAACLVLALVGATMVIRFPHGGMGLMLSGSGVVFAGYYLSLVAGEALADRQLLSPFVAMWMANVLLLGVALLLAWRPVRPGTSGGTDVLAIGE